jgi:hypothetical protein
MRSAGRITGGNFSRAEREIVAHLIARTIWVRQPGNWAANIRGMGSVPNYVPPDEKSVAEIEGPWVQPDGVETGLIERCRRYWATPIKSLPNGILAMFLRQEIALRFVAAEATARIDSGVLDGSELYDDELAEALRQVKLDR